MAVVKPRVKMGCPGKREKRAVNPACRLPAFLEFTKRERPRPGELHSSASLVFWVREMRKAQALDHLHLANC